MQFRTRSLIPFVAEPTGHNAQRYSKAHCLVRSVPCCMRRESILQCDWLQFVPDASFDARWTRGHASERMSHDARHCVRKRRYVLSSGIRRGADGDLGRPGGRDRRSLAETWRTMRDRSWLLHRSHIIRQAGRHYPVTPLTRQPSVPRSIPLFLNRRLDEHISSIRFKKIFCRHRGRNQRRHALT